jgi:hypothetical protein
VALPAATAAADEQIAPPKADAYLQPVFLNSGNALVAGDQLTFGADTTSYTTQKSLYDPKFDANGNTVKGPAGPAEPTSCGSTRYGRTIWTAFHAKRYGVAEITATSTSFDPVVRVVEFASPQTNPAPDVPGSCFDDGAGLTQTASGIVTPGQWYAIQVGGTSKQKKSPAGGPVQVKIALDPPPVVDGDAVLRYSGGKVVSLKVAGVPAGAVVSLACAKHACKSVTKTRGQVEVHAALEPQGQEGHHDRRADRDDRLRRQAVRLAGGRPEAGQLHEPGVDEGAQARHL